ncbi:type IV secretion system DNA-binding domain-containing protein [Novosphingobium sp. 9U]|uniref:type IV secretion system DNA-binding domain-containing protein n=1 Tax=Novosphingobium sp. 9U TaxID=2653158 RepID=UPI0012F2DD2F|nr:type IV secretion system DNA-binding domain-containing protein [Novosphingobium sp. 9U]VWX51091.1 Conjugal transfer protein TraD [Novosphingobium sp. 9U]
MRKNRAADDIRFNGQSATIKHHSERGKVVRNSGSFTRGSQLVTHEVLMTWQGVKLPLQVVAICWITLFSGIAYFWLLPQELSLILMRIWSGFWLMMDFDPAKLINLKLPNGNLIQIPMASVKYNSHVVIAVDKGIRLTLASFIGAAFLTVPLTVWFVDFSRKRGSAILDEHHERGSMLVERPMLIDAIRHYNMGELNKECAKHSPPLAPKKVAMLSVKERARRGFHVPYTLAGVPYPWRLEQSHTMFIGTTGSGKTTQLRALVSQARNRGHSCVIFDLTGAFVEAFYDPERDFILNPMDTRCPPWTIFSDCHNHADFMAAAAALIPSSGDNAEPFWAMAARTLFVEMCIKLIECGETSNGAIAARLMQADLPSVHKMLENTIADPLTAKEAARMAESIRAVFNTNGQAIRFLPDPVPGGAPPFSINDWMVERGGTGSILFISSTHADLTLNRALLTLWMDLAVGALMKMPRTRDLRTWFLFDEVHALHRLPAIEHGLQTARAFGGAFILGMHSFSKLAETYGENGAVHLTSLAGTKLILKTADMPTAKVCADFIGNREVRRMDEAYSYGANSTRDAATLTPRKEVEPLVIPDDIKELPSMHGFVKFPDGFPAGRIKLEWRDYPAVAEPFCRKTDMTMAAYKPPKKKGSEDEGGRENAGVATTTTQPPEKGAHGPGNEPEISTSKESAESSEAQRVLDLRKRGEDADARTNAVDQQRKGGSEPTSMKSWRESLAGAGVKAIEGRPDRPTDVRDPTQSRSQNAANEQLISFEERHGIGAEDVGGDKAKDHSKDHEPDIDDGMDVGL